MNALIHTVEHNIASAHSLPRDTKQLMQNLALALVLVSGFAAAALLAFLQAGLGVAESSRILAALAAALQAAQKRIAEGECSAHKIRAEMQEIIEAQKDTRVDYISVCDPEQFNELEEIKGKTLIALAVHVGQTRLIDNCLIERIESC